MSPIRTKLAPSLSLTRLKISSTPIGFFHLSNLETWVIMGLLVLIPSFDSIFSTSPSLRCLFFNDNGSMEGAMKNWGISKSLLLYFLMVNIAPSYCFANEPRYDHASLSACLMSIWHLQIQGCLFLTNFIMPKGCGS